MRFQYRDMHDVSIVVIFSNKYIAHEDETDYTIVRYAAVSGVLLSEYLVLCDKQNISRFAPFFTQSL